SAGRGFESPSPCCLPQFQAPEETQKTTIMPTDEDFKRDDAGDAPPHPTLEETERANELIAPKDGVVAVVHDDDDGEEEAPNELGSKRFVYAAYFAGAIGVAFIVSKFGEYIWHLLS